MPAEQAETIYDSTGATIWSPQFVVKHRYRNWTSQQMTDAMEAIRNGMSDRKAAAVFNIPRRTLREEAERCRIKSQPMYVEPPITNVWTSFGEDSFSQQVNPTEISNPPATTVDRHRQRRWTDEQMNEALKAVQQGMRFSEAATTFDIPMISIYARARRCGIERPKCPQKSSEVVLKGSKNWTTEQMNNALKAVKEGMVLYRAAITYNIPQPTLWTYAKRFGVLQREETIVSDDTVLGYQHSSEDVALKSELTFESSEKCD